MPRWAILLWFGVIAVVISWVLGFAQLSAGALLALPISLILIPLVWLATRDARWAVWAVLVCGLVVLVLSTFWLVLLVGLASGQSPLSEWLVLAILPAIGGAALFIGTLWGLRATARPA